MATAKLTTLMNLFVAVDRFLQEQLRADDNSPPFALLDYTILELVCGSPTPPTMRDLSRFLGVTPPAVTGMVDHLVKQKVLCRAPDKEDRRRVLLYVTVRGRKQHETNLRALKKKMSVPFRVLSDNDLNALVRILKKLIESNKIK